MPLVEDITRAAMQMDAPRVSLIIFVVAERLWLLRRRPQRRLVVVWMTAILLVEWDIIRRAMVARCRPPLPDETDLLTAITEAIPILMWAAVFAAADYVILETMRLWSDRRALSS